MSETNEIITNTSGSKEEHMVWLLFGETVQEDILDLLDDSDVPFYSVWRDVLARDNEGEGTRWDDPVFPGHNWAIQFLCDDDGLEDLLNALHNLLRDPFIAQSGIRLYVQKASRLL